MPLTLRLHIAAFALLALIATSIAGCTGAKRTADRPAATTAKQPTTTKSTTPANASTGVTPAAMTLSERLAVLDARIKKAPADSLAALFAEYHRLLALRNGERVKDEGTAPALTGSTPFPMSAPMGDSAERRRRLAEGQSHGWSGADTARLVDVPAMTAPGTTTTPSGTTATLPGNATTSSGSSSTPVSATPETLLEPKAVDTESASTASSLVTSTTPYETTPMPATIATTPASTPATTPSSRPQTTKSSIATADPSRIFKGLRPSEIATIPGHERTKTARSTTRSSVQRTARRTAPRRAPKRDDGLSAAPRTRAFATTAPRAAATINGRGQRKDAVAGIAAARAGKYADAVTKLAPTIASGRASADARYYYALSLEKIGQISKASDEYLRASRGSGAMADRAYLDYCRMLARGGSRDKARQLLTQFIKRGGDGTQVVAARRLLQTL